jgi:competence protein ComEA
VRRRLALTILLAACLLPTGARRVLSRPRPAPDCEPEGRGTPPGHWIGCRGDEGPSRLLTGAELVLLGRPVDLNRASAEDLAAVPGLTPALAGAVVADRAERGRFETVDGLERVRGIGPVRLSRARPWLMVREP